MESDHDHQPTSEKPATDGDEQGASVVTNPRSYECNFCKRGFSNAQALGGHMNIHRKDKAKLNKQQSSNQTQQPSLHFHHHKVLPPLESKSVEERSNPNWPWNVSQQSHASSRDETHVIHMRQLPLFAESPTSSEGQIHGEITTQRALSSAQVSSSELDLELRLGPEPQDSSAATSTRKFF